MTSEAQLSSVSKNKQKFFKHGSFVTKIYQVLNTKKYLKSGVVMLLNVYRKSKRLLERLVALLLDSESDIESIISSIVIVDLAILTQDLHLMPS